MNFVVNLSFSLTIGLAAFGAHANQTNYVAGDMFTLTNLSTAPNGAWSWFEDNRVIVDASNPAGPMLLVSSVSAASSGSERGDVDLLWRNLATRQQGNFELHNRLQQDDHDSAALYVRTDGRYLAMYSKHGNDNFTRFRVSTNPNDPTSWGPAQSRNAGARATYNNIHFLPEDNNGEGRLYNITRTVNWDPNIQISNDQGSTWTNAGKLLTQGGSRDRPYLKYASDSSRIHFIATEEHPHDFNNSIYHGYIQDGKLYNSSGQVKDNNLFNGSGVSPTQLTTVLAANSQHNGVSAQRMWTVDLELDNAGNPVGILSGRANGSRDDHRFYYAQYDGSQWHVNELGKAGGYLYDGQWDYTGLVAIDPDDPRIVYMSSEIDPRDDLSTDKYEIYRGITNDLGSTWSWEAITENSTVDNLRPIVPEWNTDQTALVWMRGNYNTFRDWDTEVVGLVLVPEPKSILLLSFGAFAFLRRPVLKRRAIN